MQFTTRVTVRAIATVMLFGGTSMTATANPQGYDEIDQRIAFFYGDFDDDVLLFAGGTAAEFCADDTGVPSVAKLWAKPDGTTVLRSIDRDVPLYLYHSDLGAPEFIGATCEVLFDGDPDTVPDTPFATGSGLVKQKLTYLTTGDEHHVNKVVGRASGPGARYIVKAWADLVVGEFGPVGDPADFQGLDLTTIRMS